MLYEHQKSAVDKMVWALSALGGNSVISIPTGGGKSHVISGFVEATGLPVLILCLTKELVEQDLEKLKQVVSEDEIGVYSASMNEKQVKKYTIGTIQSVKKHPELFTHYTVVILDECHTYNPKNLKGMYNAFFKEIGNPVVFGLTATPYRQDVFYKSPNGWNRYSGKVWQKAQLEAVTTVKMVTRYKEKFWDRLLYVTNTFDLQQKGLLCYLEYDDRSFIRHEEIPTNITRSDFDLDAFEELISEKEQSVVTQIKEISAKHKSVLVFCSSIAQASRLSSVIPSSNYVEGSMGRKERETAINDFKRAGGVLFNVGILTTGFDYPSLSAIVLLRPTRSLNLYNQMLGRLTRTANGKDHGTVYDFSGTVKSLGRIESIQMKKVNGQWDVTSESYPLGMHNKELYTYKLQRKAKDDTRPDERIY
jgi:DNA repair protein RadD